MSVEDTLVQIATELNTQLPILLENNSAAYGYKIEAQEAAATATAQALLASEYTQDFAYNVDTAQELRDLFSCTDRSAVVRTLGALTKGDGGGGVWYWDETSEADDNLGTVLLPTSWVGAGRWVAVNSSHTSAAQWGIVPSATGAENSARLLAALTWAGQQDNKEIWIYFSGGTYEFAPQVYDSLGAIVHLCGNGFRNVNFISSETTGWMMEFLSMQVHLDWISIGTAGIERTFDGIRCFESSLFVRKCYGVLIRGTALQVERLYNGEIDINTVECGDATAGKWAMLICGSPDSISNDVTLRGTTEKDQLGWCIENTAVLRTAEPIKLHGGDNSVCTLMLHGVHEGIFEGIITYKCGGPDRIIVADRASSIPFYGPETTVSGADSSRFQLNLNMRRSTIYTGDDIGSVVGFYLANEESAIKLSGNFSVLNLEGAGDFVHLRYYPECVGIVDTTDFFTEVGQAVKQIDDQRVTKKFGGYRVQPSSISVRDNSIDDGNNSEKGTFYTLRKTVQDGAYRVATPKILTVEGTNAYACVPGFHTVYGFTASTATELELFAPMWLPQMGDISRVVQVTISADQFVTYDVANYWTLELYANSELIDTLKVAYWSSGLYTQGDPGYPMRQAAYASRKSMVFFAGKGINEINEIPAGAWFYGRLVAVGSPAAITNVQAHALVEMRGN